ncbi:unnamed protein product [Pedinophyceae sp. YPF-701]|nr:unnamed protein product [Pedinophyceae sp. YPF-701]
MAAPAGAPTGKARDISKPFNGGELLICGSTDWDQIGRKDPKKKDQEAERLIKYPNLTEPHRFKAVIGKKIHLIAAGSSACHSVIVDGDGKAYAFGRNEFGQLGLGDTVQRNAPTQIEGPLKDKKVVAAACGKHHTIVVTEDGEAYAMGSNKHGQLGIGQIDTKVPEHFLTTPTKCQVPKCQNAKCGAEFSVWVCDGALYSAGLPQYGQLGHGTDHQYNAADNTIKLVFEPQPVPKKIEGLLRGKTVTSVACGNNHCVCVTKEGLCFTWGDGGYGKLGHNKQHEEKLPRPVEALLRGYTCAPDSLLAASQNATLATVQPDGQLFACGKLKVSGDGLMRPMPLQHLQGWKLRDISAGTVTFAVCSDTSTVTWGQAQYGECGFGPNGKKSSANPERVPSLEGILTQRVACGMGHTMFLVEATEEQLKDFPVWESEVTHEEEEEHAKEREEKRKRKLPQGGGASKKARR